MRSLQSCTAATLLFSVTCRICPCQGDLPDFAFCNASASWSHCTAGHTAQLQFCVHTIASVQAKQYCMQTISAAKHPARPVGMAVTSCCVTAAAGWAAIPTQGPEHLLGSEVTAPKNLGTNILPAVRLCLTVVAPTYAIAIHGAPCVTSIGQTAT